MARTIVLSAFFLLLLYPLTTRAQDLVDFGACNVRVVEAREIEGFKGEKGNVVKPSRRDTRLVEVELEISPDSSGAFGLYPAMFSALFQYRGVTQVAPAVAIGTKILDRMSGDSREYWYNEPDVSIILEFKAGERFSKYVVLEVPEEVSDFVVQGPAVIQAVELGHAE